MTHPTRRTVALFVGAVLVAFVGFAAQIVAPNSPVEHAGRALIAPPPTAEASTHDTTVRAAKGTDRDVEVARHWIGYNGATVDYSEGVWYLSAGHNSRTGAGSPHWRDTDAYRIPYGYRAKLTGGTVGARYVTGAGWHKISGTAGSTITVELQRT